MLTICLSPELYIREHDAQRLGRSSSEYSADRPSRDKREAAAACAPSAPRQGPTPNRKRCLSDLDLTDVLSSDAVVHRWTRSVQRVQQTTFAVTCPCAAPCSARNLRGTAPGLRRSRFSDPCRGCFWFGCANGVARSACVWVNNSASVTARPYMRCLLAFVLYWAVTAHCEPSRFRSRRDPRRRSSSWTHAMFRAGVSGGVAEHARAIEATLRRSWTVRYLCETACTHSHAADTS